MTRGGRRLVVLVSLATAVLAAEVALRVGWGLGSPPLYVASPEYEYVLAPDQDVRRGGNRVATNAFSMRSAPVEPPVCPAVLYVGDSVINGGAPTDHDLLATTLLEAEMQRRVDPRARVLNVSAGSWGPDNAAAYLRRHGHFGAGLIVAVFGSRDAGDEMTHAPVVGVDPNYPASRPATAMGEVVSRYVVLRLRTLVGADGGATAPAPAVDGRTRLNPGWTQLVRYAREAGVPLVVYLHAETDEVAAGEYRAGGRAILAFLASERVPVVRGVTTLTDPRAFRDEIHPNDAGQAALARAFVPVVAPALAAQRARCPA